MQWFATSTRLCCGMVLCLEAGCPYNPQHSLMDMSLHALAVRIHKNCCTCSIHQSSTCNPLFRSKPARYLDQWSGMRSHLGPDMLQCESAARVHKLHYTQTNHPFPNHNLWRNCTAGVLLASCLGNQCHCHWGISRPCSPHRIHNHWSTQSMEKSAKNSQTFRRSFVLTPEGRHCNQRHAQTNMPQLWSVALNHTLCCIGSKCLSATYNHTSYDKISQVSVWGNRDHIRTSKPQSVFGDQFHNWYCKATNRSHSKCNQLCFCIPLLPLELQLGNETHRHSRT
jgi:hypothetical protein